MVRGIVELRQPRDSTFFNFFFHFLLRGQGLLEEIIPATRYVEFVRRQLRQRPKEKNKIRLTPRTKILSSGETSDERASETNRPSGGAVTPTMYPRVRVDQHRVPGVPRTGIHKV